MRFLYDTINICASCIFDTRIGLIRVSYVKIYASVTVCSIFQQYAH